MPSYVYKCKECGLTEELRHALDTPIENLFLTCGHNAMEKVPPGALNIRRTIQPKEKQVGDLVKNTIEETKEYLRTEKAEAGKKTWKPSS